MLLPRKIPVLLISEGRLVKTVRFGSPNYIGDPINAARIFSEFEADELMVLDISATKKGYNINYKLIEKMAKQCRMPICYGGGIKNAQHAEKLIGIGIEKVAISTMLFQHENLLEEVVESIGSQSVVAVLDICRDENGYTLYSNNAKVKLNRDPIQICDSLVAAGVGEISFNCIHRDGTWLGLDEELIAYFYPKISVPVTFIGGANSHENIDYVLSKYGVIGVAAGSLFVYRNNDKAVLLNYMKKK